MKNYILTVFNQQGEKLLEEPFEAQTDEEAKAMSKRQLTKEGYNNYAYRCTRSDAKLVLFNNGIIS